MGELIFPCECHIPGCLCRVHDVPRPAVDRPDQGDGERCSYCEHDIARHGPEAGGCIECPCPAHSAPAVDPARGAEEPTAPEYGDLACFRGRHEDGGWYCVAHGQGWPCTPPATSEAVVTDLRAGLVDGVGRAALVEAVARWLYEFEREAYWDDAAEWVRADFRPHAAKLLDGPLAAALGRHGEGKCVSVEDANRVLAQERAGYEAALRTGRTA